MKLSSQFKMAVIIQNGSDHGGVKIIAVLSVNIINLIVVTIVDLTIVDLFNVS